MVSRYFPKKHQRLLRMKCENPIQNLTEWFSVKKQNHTRVKRISKTSKIINYEMEKSCIKVDRMIIRNKKEIKGRLKIVWTKRGNPTWKLTEWFFVKKNQIHVKRIHKSFARNTLKTVTNENKRLEFEGSARLQADRLAVRTKLISWTSDVDW